MKKLLTTLAVLTVMATPAFAQSVTADGDYLPLGYHSTKGQSNNVGVPRYRLNAFAGDQSESVDTDGNYVPLGHHSTNGQSDNIGVPRNRLNAFVGNQSVDADGDYVPLGYHSTNGKIGVPRNGLNAFDRALEVPSVSNPNDPALSGGGSLGYNSGLLDELINR